MGKSNNQQPSQTGITVGGIIGAGIALAIWFLLLRSPHGGYLFVDERITIFVLTAVFGTIGAAVGFVFQSYLERSNR